MVDFVLNAQVREDEGKGASRRLRRLAGLVPAIIYGGKKDPQSISVSHKDTTHALENEAFYSHLITINIDGGSSEEVILKDVQRHPARGDIMHLDFQRVDRTQKLHTKVPLHFINEETSKGVKAGGIVQHLITELDIQCLPQDLPEYIEVDIANLELGGILHISDITLPAKVESVDLSHGEEYDHPIASIIKPRGMVEDTEEDEASESESDED